MSICSPLFFFSVHCTVNTILGPLGLGGGSWGQKAGVSGPKLTIQVPPLVVQHNILAVEHLTADLTGKLLVPMFLLVLREVAVGGEESETHLTLERLVICPENKHTTCGKSPRPGSRICASVGWAAQSRQESSGALWLRTHLLCVLIHTHTNRHWCANSPSPGKAASTAL